MAVKFCTPAMEEDFLELRARAVAYAPGALLFAQGDACDTIMYIRRGEIQLSVISPLGQEAQVGTLGPGDFIGEEALTMHPVHSEAAHALVATSVFVLTKMQMHGLLHSNRALKTHFIAHLLKRNSRLEDDLVNQLFNSAEKRLARTLLLVSGLDKDDVLSDRLPPLSQLTLAQTIGTTRSRVNLLLNKFRRLGFICYGADGFVVNRSLRSVVHCEHD